MKFAVIGGGILGISVAYSLMRHKHKVKIFEKSDKVGGLASSFGINWDGKNYTIPITYRHFTVRDYNLINELGLSKSLGFKKIATSIFWDGYTMKLDVKNFISNLRELILRNDIPLKSKAKLLAPAIQNFRVEKNALNLGYFNEGYATFICEIEKKFSKNNIKVLKKVLIKQIDFNKKVIEYTLNKNKKIEKFDKIVSTISPDILLKLTKRGTLPKNIERRIRKIKYGDVASLCIGINKKIDSDYILHVYDKNYPFSEIINHTSYYNSFGNKTVLYLLSYDKKIIKLKDKELEELFEKWLKKIFPEIDGYISWKRLFRFKTFRNSPILFAFPLLSEKMVGYNGSYILYHNYSNSVSRNFIRFTYNAYNTIFKRYSLDLTFGLLSSYGLSAAEDILKASKKALIVKKYY